MKLSLMGALEMDAGTLAHWRALQQSNPALASPYFSPEFTQQVACTRDDVRVAVLEDARGVVGYFPHQRRGGRGQPVGGGLSDHHGLICAPGQPIDWAALLKACGLAFWAFDHLPLSQAPQRSTRRAESPGLDLSRGFAAWKQARVAAGGRRIAELDRKARKMARELGPLRFEANSQDRRVFETVLRLKSEQCRRTGVPDFFSQAWTRELAERLWHCQAPGFGGRLSALFAGDQLVGAHLGMRSEAVWHWWFPVYAHEHARHSPGAQLLMAVAHAAAEEGHRLLDLGKGDDAYKHSFADCASPLAEGWVFRPGPLAAMEAARGGLRQWLRQSPWLAPIKPLVRRARRLVTG
ncbi:GNAT family N-acetyltransferase [Ramlibacter rhizophilus]|uniref:GNAT family N-acetyltransferase n=1 Tax=Ramlibacter rhizophilus TaxID=1781167 RepID=A0A4Z0BGM1_9BURK|nr:GNAT family N-acetyltransferase [Ramlibacter rhizophilus]TFY97284.1 GNAT family N-acetyltransferase [Ramlibacter rhizophilus]